MDNKVYTIKWFNVPFTTLLLYGGIFLAILSSSDIYKELIRNQAYLNATSFLSFDPPSPYVALINPDVCEPDVQYICPIQIVLNGLDSAALSIQDHSDFIPLISQREATQLAQGGLALQSGERERAVRIWQQIPGVENFLLKLAEEAQEQERSFDLYRLSLEIHPTMVTAHKFAKVLAQMGDYDQALEKLDLALTFPEPDMGNYRGIIYNEMGNTYRQMGDYQKAKESYETALILRWDLVESIVGLAVLDMADGNLNAAADRLLTALQNGINNPNIPFRLAQAYWRMGNVSDALRILQELVQVNENFSPAWFLIGQIFESQKNKREACFAYSNGLLTAPENDGIWDIFERLGCNSTFPLP